MDPIEHFKNLKEQKRALMAESDLNRILLQLEVRNLRASTARLDSTLTTARRVGPWLLPVFSAVGFFAGRRARKTRKESPKTSSKMDWIKLGLRFLPMILSWQRSKSQAE